MWTLLLLALGACQVERGPLEGLPRSMPAGDRSLVVWSGQCHRGGDGRGKWHCKPLGN
jgi:hypothetical protein